jgi:hypothetical protein
MNIAIISDFNIAGQCTALMRAINKYTSHKARCIILNDDYLSYDRDLILIKRDQFSRSVWDNVACEEAIRWVKQCDFFHFGRGIITWLGWSGQDWNGRLTKDNCCIKYYGSELRNNPAAIVNLHRQTSIAAITGTDWSIASLLPGAFYHLGSYFTKYGDMDLADIPHCTINDPVRVCCGSAGSPLKGYNYLKETVDNLRLEKHDIELDIISGLDNQACLERKLKSFVTFTSLHGAWGISGIESMLMGHIVMSCLDPWILSMYPENPTVLITKENLREKLLTIINMSLDSRAMLSQISRDFAYRNFNTRVILKRYMYLIDLIMNRDEYAKGFQAPKNIY